jgi:NADP-dependent 3-hydroxy acid dehydrogenase YdfG
MITVMGATAHTGKKITETLLKAREKVRALGRSESKLADLKSAGAADAIRFYMTIVPTPTARSNPALSDRVTSKYIKKVMKLSSTVGRVAAWDRGLRTRGSRRYERQEGRTWPHGFHHKV